MPFNNPITGGQGALVRERIKSPDYIPGVQGWSINKDGSAEFNNVTVRGELFVTDPDGSYVHIFNENPGDGSVIELRLPNAAGAVIVPARIRSGVTPHFTDPALEVLGPNVDGHGTAAIYSASGPTGGGVVELHAEDYAWLDTNGCSWVVAGDWELAHETAPNVYAIHFQVWVDGTVICGAVEADSLTVRPGGSVIIQAGDLDVTGDAAISGDVDIASTGSLIGQGIGVSLGVRKSGNTTRVNTAAMAVDPHLQLAVVPGTYDFEIDVRWTADPAPDIKFDVGQVPAGTTLGRWSAWTNGTAAVWSSVQATEATALFQAATLGVDFAVLIKGTAVFTNAGTFGLRWAQNGVSANGSTVYAGSMLSMTRRA
jgi:hypothetical protein